MNCESLNNIVLVFLLINLIDLLYEESFADVVIWKKPKTKRWPTLSDRVQKLFIYCAVRINFQVASTQQFFILLS